ncbi:MAG: PAQR family membrane homeostasis protein TrhA [Flavobacteriales bacterium]
MEIPVITYSKEEEYANTISHVVGFVAGFIGLLFLAYKAWGALSLLGNIGVWIFGLTLLGAMGTSSLYHGTAERRLKLFYKKLDHIFIYLLISGSYTVLILNRLVNEDGYVFLAALWGMSIVGIWFKIRYVHRFKVFSTLMYIIMGYIFFINPTAFYDVLKPETIKLLATCGGIYTVGAVFYLLKSVKWTHFIWHVLVLIAASLHFYAVYSELLG